MPLRNNTSHFEINSRFRNGIFVFAFLIAGALVANYFLTQGFHQKPTLQELSAFQKQYDSLEKVALVKKQTFQLKPFNPNFMSEYKAYVLGLSVDQVDKINTFRQQGKWMNSSKDFQKVTRVSDSALKRIQPFLKFPEWTQKTIAQTSSKKLQYATIKDSEKRDLNKISSQELQDSIGVPDFIAERIITYREKIEGFRNTMQLQDIKGLYGSQRNKIINRYIIKPLQQQKININTATVKELMEVPYFDFETALSVRDFVQEKKSLTNLEELAEIEEISLEEIDRIALYLIVD